MLVLPVIFAKIHLSTYYESFSLVIEVRMTPFKQKVNLNPFKEPNQIINILI